MKCPKCGAEIAFYNLKPNCEKCGVNIMYYTQDTDLIKDAKRAELEFASARIIGAKVKQTFIGGGLQIARLVMLLLIVSALVPPFASVNFILPFREMNLNVGGLGIYGLISDGIINSLGDLMGSTLLGSFTVKAIILYALFIIVALLDVIIAVYYILSFINIKKTAKAMTVLSFIAAVFSIAVPVAALIMKSSSASYAAISASFGGFIAVVVFVINGIINLIIYKKDMPLKLKVNDMDRKETLRKIKSGEITFDDLPLPVFETEEEREKRIKDLEEALRKEEEGKE